MDISKKELLVWIKNKLIKINLELVGSHQFELRVLGEIEDMSKPIDIEATLKLILKKLTEHDKRFDAVDKRFDAVDKRFDAIVKLNNLKDIA